MIRLLRKLVIGIPATHEQRITSFKSFHALAALAALGLLGVCGCSLWRGDLDPDFARRVDERLHRISQLNLGEKSKAPPTTVDEGIASMRDQRAKQSNTTSPTSAPATIQLSIDEARIQALRQSLNLAVYRLDPQIAQTKVSEEEAKFDATISIGAVYKKTDLPELDGPTMQFKEQKSSIDRAIEARDIRDDPDSAAKKYFEKFIGSLDGNNVKVTEVPQRKESVDIGAGLSIPLPTGGNARISQSFEQDNKLSPIFSDQSLSGAKFSLSQPLLRNAGVDVNVASIRLARLGAKSQVAKTKLYTIRVLAAAEKAYWRVYGAGQQLAVRRRINELAEKNLELVKKRAQQGMGAQIEVVRAEVGVAQQFESLIIAETNDRIQQRELKRILNLENVAINSATQLITSSEPCPLQYRLDAEAIAADAVKNRMEMLELELDLAADTLRIDYAKNQTLPLVSLDFEYGIIDRGGSFGTAWQDSWGFDKGEFGVGIRGEIPLTNEVRKSQLRRAVLARTQRLATRAERDVAIRQEVYDTLDLLNQNWQRILAARQSAMVSGVNYDAELKQFDQGKRTMREVFEALAQLGEAQIREVSAIIAYQASLIDLAYASGTLLGFSKVDFLPLDF